MNGYQYEAELVGNKDVTLIQDSSGSTEVDRNTSERTKAELAWKIDQEMFFAWYPDFLKDSMPHKMLLFMLNEKVKELAAIKAHFHKPGSEILEMALDEMLQMSRADITEYWLFVRDSAHA